MSTVRVVPLGVPVAAGLWIGGDVAMVLISLIAGVLLLLTARSARLALQTGVEMPSPRHAAR